MERSRDGGLSAVAGNLSANHIMLTDSELLALQAKIPIRNRLRFFASEEGQKLRFSARRHVVSRNSGRRGEVSRPACILCGKQTSFICSICRVAMCCSKRWEGRQSCQEILHNDKSLSYPFEIGHDDNLDTQAHDTANDIDPSCVSEKAEEGERHCPSMSVHDSAAEEYHRSESLAQPAEEVSGPDIQIEDTTLFDAVEVDGSVELNPAPRINPRTVSCAPPKDELRHLQLLVPGRNRLEFFNTQEGCKLRLSALAHVITRRSPEPSKVRSRPSCVLCGMQTGYQCTVCKVPLCCIPNSGGRASRNCHQIFHSHRQLSKGTLNDECPIESTTEFAEPSCLSGLYGPVPDSALEGSMLPEDIRLLQSKVPRRYRAQFFNSENGRKLRLSGSRHLVCKKQSRVGGNRSRHTCVLCLKQTSYECAMCTVPLCSSPKSDRRHKTCEQVFHSRLTLDVR